MADNASKRGRCKIYHNSFMAGKCMDELRGFLWCLITNAALDGRNKVHVGLSICIESAWLSLLKKVGSVHSEEWWNKEKSWRAKANHYK